MVNIIKEEILVEESLKNKLEFICDFCKVKYTNKGELSIWLKKIIFVI